MTLFDLSNITSWLSTLFIFIFISIIIGIVYYAMQDIVKRLGKKLSDSIFNFFILICKLIFFIPRLIKKNLKMWKIARCLKEQVSLLSDSDDIRRRKANQQIINQLLSPLGSETALKWKIDRSLIQYLTSDCEETKIFAIENLTRMTENPNYLKSISPDLIKILILNLSDDSEIKTQSIKFLQRIIANHLDELFIDSIDLNINETSIVMHLIELLQYTLETEEKDIQIQLKIYSLFNSYLLSNDDRVKIRVLKSLENKINPQTSSVIIEAGLIPPLLDLLNNQKISDFALNVLMKMGKSTLLPQIIQISRSKSGLLPKRELSCLIYETITSNNCLKLIEIDILKEIFEYLSDNDFQTQSCASDALIRLLGVCKDSEKKRRDILQRLTELGINRQIKTLLSSGDLDIFYCGLRIFQQIIRVYGKNAIENEEIIKTLFCCCCHSSGEVRSKAFQMIENLNISIDIIINSFCRLGLDDCWQDCIAERLAIMIQYDKEKISIHSYVTSFEYCLNPEEKPKFLRLKEKIENRLSEISDDTEQGLRSFMF